jgi:hypothetical protein
MVQGQTQASMRTCPFNRAGTYLSSTLPVWILRNAASRPRGTRSDAAMHVSALIVAAVQTPGIVDAMVKTVMDWLAHHARGGVEVTIDGDTLRLSGAPRPEKSDIVDAWLARHQ